jgi:hypothetical protein
MITIFEGPRNSGKTFLVDKYSLLKAIPVFKFDFAFWFNSLKLPDNGERTHDFALGKELMLLQLNRDGILPDFILDRGILTVLTWGVMSGRISEAKAFSELQMINQQGLLKNCQIVYVTGNNPNQNKRDKDNWDFRDGLQDEKNIMDDFIQTLSSSYKIKVKEIQNTFDYKVYKQLENL